jgi:hypothetical protein
MDFVSSPLPLLLERPGAAAVIHQCKDPLHMARIQAFGPESVVSGQELLTLLRCPHS